LKHEDFIDDFLTGTGIEIGAFETPIPGISPIYIDKFSEFAGRKSHADFMGDATALPAFSSSVDYVATSHVLEHCANPVKALLEWQRVLKPGGYVYCVIPDRRYTFDKARPLTPAPHMIEDFLKDVDDTDPTHIEDFIYGIDWAAVHPDSDPANREAERKLHHDHHLGKSQNGEEINIHFHVFEPENFRMLISACFEHPRVPWALELVRMESEFPDTAPNGFLAVLRKRAAKRRGILSRAKRVLQRAAYPSYPIRPDAVRFPAGRIPSG